MWNKLSFPTKQIDDKKMFETKCKYFFMKQILGSEFVSSAAECYVIQYSSLNLEICLYMVYGDCLSCDWGRTWERVPLCSCLQIFKLIHQSFTSLVSCMVWVTDGVCWEKVTPINLGLDPLGMPRIGGLLGRKAAAEGTKTHTAADACRAAARVQ